MFGIRTFCQDDSRRRRRHSSPFVRSVLIGLEGRKEGAGESERSRRALNALRSPSDSVYLCRAAPCLPSYLAARAEILALRSLLLLQTDWKRDISGHMH